MEPSSYLAVVNLQAALKAIAVAGGYHHDVVDTAVKLDPDTDVEALLTPGGPRPFVVLVVAPEAREYSNANRVGLAQPVTIHWVSESEPTDDTSRMLTFFRGCADVERAIAQDIGRGGHAIDTKVITCTYNTASGGSQVWAAIDVVIHSRRVYGEPDA